MRHRAALLVVLAVLALTAGPATARTDFRDPLPPDLREWARDHGPVRVGWAHVPPLSVADDEGRIVGGYGYEVHELMAIRLGIDVEQVLVGGVGDLSSALADGRIDVIGGQAPRPDLVEAFETTDPMAWPPIVFVGDEGRQSAGLGDLDGLTATTIPGSPMEATLAERFPELAYVPSESVATGLEAVASGDVDLYLGPLAIVGLNLREIGLALGPVGDAVEIQQVSAWALPDSEALRVMQIGRSLVSDDELAVIHVRWTGFDLSDPTSERPRWLLPALGASALAALVLGTFALVLRRRVQVATSDLEALNRDLEGRINARTADLAAANGRLAESNEALTKFARTAAHDLRGPVAAISGMATLLRTLEVDDQQRDEMLATVESSSGKLGRMIDSLLDEAINAGGAPPTMQTGDFAAWLRDVTRAEVDAIGGTLQIDVDEGQLEADLRVVRRSALNLVGNAIKYAANPTGTVIRAGLHRRDDHYLLAVDDNGPGVRAEDRDRIFERGIRRDHDRRGRGLGLADVRDLAQSVGGTVTVGDSELGGARFEVVIPFASASATPATLPEVDAADA